MITPHSDRSLPPGRVYHRGLEICDFLFGVAQDLDLDPPERMKAIIERLYCVRQGLVARGCSDAAKQRTRAQGEVGFAGPDISDPSLARALHCEAHQRKVELQEVTKVERAEPRHMEAETWPQVHHALANKAIETVANRGHADAYQIGDPRALQARTRRPGSIQQLLLDGRVCRFEDMRR